MVIQLRSGQKRLGSNARNPPEAEEEQTWHSTTPRLPGGLQPGAYRIEAVLSGWVKEKFTDVERSELARMPYPLLRGEVPNSVRITPNAK
jgi:hypothetical protein